VEKVRLRLSSKIWAGAVVVLVVAQMLAPMLLPKSYRLAAITDWIDFGLMVSASIAFARNTFSSSRQQRLVWILLGLGYAIEAGSQLLWMHWHLVMRQTPLMSLGDAGIYLAWTALILAFALRPHVKLTTEHQRLGTLDLLLLLLWGLYLYLFLVIPWQYLFPDPQSYGPAYKYLALGQDMILLSIVLHGWLRSFGQWRYFYALLTAIVALDTVMEYFVDTFSQLELYFTGSWYHSTVTSCLGGMTIAALMAYRLEPVSEYGDPNSEHYWRWTARLAAPIALILPLFTAWSFFDPNLPGSVRKFRVALSLAAIVVFGVIGLVKQFRLQRDLAEANRELLDASLTDLLTGVRNRRFFAHSIQSDVQQVLRSFGTYPAESRNSELANNQPRSQELRNRDLVFYLLDIDDFKRINDQFGHKAGDQVLVEVARRITSASRLSDAVIRWGGEEFLVLSRYTDRKEAHVLANRVMVAVGDRPYRVEGSEVDLRVTCSIGWAVFPWKETEPKLVSHDQAVVLADYALYQAKGSGKNCAVGLMPAGETVRAAIAAPTIYVDGIPASPVTTPGPQIGAISPPTKDEIPPHAAAATGIS
jgi:diguanylate cyclase (GGDEF)-like protein